MELLLRVDEGQMSMEYEALLQDLPKVGTPLEQLRGAGFGLLASGIGRLGGVLRGQQAALPTQRPVVVLFVLGGVSPQELREVAEVMAAAPRGRTVEQVLVGATALATPDLVYEQVFCRGAVDV
jgi:hypothetical protein